MNTIAQDKFVIYGLHCTCHPNSRIRYIGQTSKGAANRLSHHAYNARNGLQYPVYCWMRKHNVENIAYSVLESVSDPEMLDDAEIRLIAKYGTDVSLGGLNLWPGGKSVRGYTHADDAKTRNPKRKYYSPESVARMSAASSSRYGDKSARATITEDVAKVAKDMLWRGCLLKDVATELSTTKSVIAGISAGSTWRQTPWPIGPRNASTAGRFAAGVGVGEKTRNSIFTENQIREIRSRNDAGEKYAHLGKEYGTSGTNIRYICLRKTWAHVV